MPEKSAAGRRSPAATCGFCCAVARSSAIERVAAERVAAMRAAERILMLFFITPSPARSAIAAGVQARGAPWRLRQQVQWAERPALPRRSAPGSRAAPSPRPPASRGCATSDRCRSWPAPAAFIERALAEQDVAEAEPDAPFHLRPDDIRVHRHTAIDRA